MKGSECEEVYYFYFILLKKNNLSQ